LLLGGTLTLGILILGPAGAAAAANGQVCMGVVVDDGPNTNLGNWSPVAVLGANVAPGTSDLQALSSAGDTSSENDAGLVCAINNYPGTVANNVQNCLKTQNGEYLYWAYWEGDPYTNTWTYASIGPAEHTVNNGQTYVEGWSYQDPGPDNANATKPSVSPARAFAQACPGVQPFPSGGSGGAGDGGSAGGGIGGTAGGSAPASSNQSATASTTTTAAGTGSAPPRAAAGTAASSRTGETTTPPGSPAPAPPSGARGTSTTTTSTGAATITNNGHGHGHGHAALADPRPHGTPGGGDPALPIVIVGAVIVLLGGLAWWRWRRRPAEE
jgi:hypothetical protein